MSIKPRKAKNSPPKPGVYPAPFLKSRGLIARMSRQFQNHFRKVGYPPERCGVYFFLKNEKPIYIGKAANLKKRLSSYFRKNQSMKVVQLIQEATSLKWIKTESEIDALIKEAELIKKYRPKYNIVMRDDKNYFYVAITKDKFPRVFITHQPNPSQKTKDERQKSYIGPFTSGVALKSVLRMLRKIFPYCTCFKPHKRPCLNSEIGRCPGYCCLKSGLQHSHILQNVRMLSQTKNTYRKNIRNIVSVLNGKVKKLLRKLKEQMRHSVKKQNFENAAEIRDQIWGLENIFLHRRFLTLPLQYSAVLKWTKIEKTIKKILGTEESISRVEGYDISNISGTEATGSRVVFIDGKPAKSEYRKFKIKTVNQISDVDMLKEVVSRRVKHNEWPMPDLMLIDGGKPQLNAALAVLKNYQLLVTSNHPAVAALAKREEELYLENRQNPIRLSNLPRQTAFFFQRVRDESHRFAKSYHHKLRRLKFSVEGGKN